MAEEHEICPETGLEDGGVLLPDLDVEVNPDDEASSASSSSLEIFPASSHDAYTWFHGSDTTSPPVTDVPDQQALFQPVSSSSWLPIASEGAGIAMFDEANNTLQAQIPVLQESESLQHDEHVNISTSQGDTLMGSQLQTVLHTTDSGSIELQGNGSVAQGPAASAPPLFLDGQDLDDSPSTALPLYSSDEDVAPSNVFREYFPRTRKY